MSILMARQGRRLAACLNFFERVDQTIECVQSLVPSNLNIYIFNPGCSGSSREALGRFCDQFKQVRIFDSSVNLGVSAGRNFLITNTNEEWLLFVDNDVKVMTSDWVNRFWDYLRLYQDTDVFVPRIFIAHEKKYMIPLQLTVKGKEVWYDETNGVPTSNLFPGTAFFVRRKFFDRWGLFDERLYAFEDLELCLRGVLSRNPVRVIWVPDIEIAHKHELARNERERQAALVRYDYERIEQSYAWMTEKHGVYFSNGWREWVASQRTLVLDEKETRAHREK